MTDEKPSWWNRRMPNRWVASGVPGLITFGGGCVWQAASGRSADAVAIYAVLALASVAALVFGLRRASHTGKEDTPWKRRSGHL